LDAPRTGRASGEGAPERGPEEGKQRQQPNEQPGLRRRAEEVEQGGEEAQGHGVEQQVGRGIEEGDDAGCRPQQDGGGEGEDGGEGAGERATGEVAPAPGVVRPSWCVRRRSGGSAAGSGMVQRRSRCWER
jgi:hypothetical protein